MYVSTRLRLKTSLHHSAIHKPRLEHLELRLPPGAVLIGALLAATLERSLPRCGEIERPDKLDSTPPYDVGDVLSLTSENGSIPRRLVVFHTPSVERTDSTYADETAVALAPSSYPTYKRAERSAVGQTAHFTQLEGATMLSPSVPSRVETRAMTAGPVLSTLNNPIPPSPSSAPQISAALENFDTIPAAFEANRGQANEQVDFIARSGDSTVFLTPTAMVFSIQQSTTDRSGGRQPPESGAPQGAHAPRSDVSVKGVGLYMNIVGGNPNARPTATNQQPGIVNYFIGNDPSQWQPNIPTFGRVEYEDVYPGIDLVYYGKDSQMEYDFVVSPGADPTAITLNFAGANNVELSPQGDLILHTVAGDVLHEKPFTYQEIDNSLREVTSQYKLNGTQVRFELGTYDPTRPLVIDPVVRKYSSYLGASDYDTGEGIAMDNSGNAYLTGTSQSADYPTTPGAFDTLYNGAWETFVTKLNADGSALVYSTYLGGSNANDFGYAMAVDGSGNAYVTGTTQSSNFPTTPGAVDTSYNGGWDSFVTKLNANGAALEYSTFLGGGSDDYGYGVGVDNGGNAYIAGSTTSSNFPTTPGAFDPTFNSGPSDPFVTKLNTAGSGLSYSTFVGGTVNDYGDAIAVDASGNAYLTGWTMSSNFPTTVGAFDTGHNGVVWDAFATKINNTGSALVYSTFLGGSGDDYGHGIAVDSAGNAFVTGETASSNFPATPGSFDTSHNGNSDVFVTKLNAAGSSLVYSSFLGGSGSDIAYGIAIDAEGGSYVAGSTASGNFPTTASAVDGTYNGGTTDAFMAKLAASGSKLVYSTFTGGSNVDSAAAIAANARGEACVTGLTWSINFPTTSPAHDTSLNGQNDAFVTKLVGLVAALPQKSPIP